MSSTAMDIVTPAYLEGKPEKEKKYLELHGPYLRREKIRKTLLDSGLCIKDG